MDDAALETKLKLPIPEQMSDWTIPINFFGRWEPAHSVSARQRGYTYVEISKSQYEAVCSRIDAFGDRRSESKKQPDGTYYSTVFIYPFSSQEVMRVYGNPLVGYCYLLKLSFSDRYRSAMESAA